MPASIAYPAVARTIRASFTVSFLPSDASARALSSDTICYVRVSVPTGYRIHCDMFRPIALPKITVPSCEMDPGNDTVAFVALEYPRLAGFGELVMGFGLDLPEETPPDHVFAVVLFDYRNRTIDANVGIPGIAIPPPRLKSQLVWELRGFENLAWLEAWAEAANTAGIFSTGIAEGLGVPNTTVAIHAVKARLKESAARRLSKEREEPEYEEEEAPQREKGEDQEAKERRRLEVLVGEVAVNFSVAIRLDSLDPNSFDRLIAKFNQSDIPSLLTSSTHAVLAASRLVPMTLTDAALSSAIQQDPPNVTRPQLLWTASGAGDLAQISLGVTFGQPTDMVVAVLLIVPTGFRHELRYQKDLRAVRRGARKPFPVAQESTTWVDSRSTGTVRVFVEKGALVNEGGYAFELPVRVPAVMPAVNVWRLCLCTSRECDSPDHPSVITTLSMPGFRHGDPPPLPLALLVAGAWPSPRRPSLAAVVLAATVAAWGFLSG